ncbi:MAG: helix-turn-helix domain-containing protein [Promethearchaeota archaeon]
MTQKIAEYFQVSPSAILNHIQKAERSIMEYFFG